MMLSTWLPLCGLARSKSTSQGADSMSSLDRMTESGRMSASLMRFSAKYEASAPLLFSFSLWIEAFI